MEKTYNLILERLKIKRDDLKRCQDYFQDMVKNEINTARFEQNAITSLLTMRQVKTEIKELEHWELLLRMTLCRDKVIES
ncbi:hypothetical protein IMSAGC013_03509 [Lachnospiraceae bacterium]|nr:hypothetical protein IMSAGC013_03509 [Lachnospiraceae bacterium]